MVFIWILYSFMAFSFSLRLCWFTAFISNKFKSFVLTDIWGNCTSWCKNRAVTYFCGLPHIYNSSCRVLNNHLFYNLGETTVYRNLFLKGHNCLLSWATPPENINRNFPWYTTCELIYFKCILLFIKQPLINRNLTKYAGTQYADFLYIHFLLDLHGTFPQQFSRFFIPKVTNHCFF